ncbi:hypothetical protein FC21_GL000507 [Limosilactobacillus equigenerosi DSM 18793 = JCM 14505]|uniref:Uncharacterized protein n=2 Tax=Limosilactobacillus TaxID=2742598 RepID=A0A0R1UYZ6_9LACO|nr:hypothetical protein FC21_GL000507 [Limosilactobacillus equigenerosi DSM 18793 = JCM 14505]
MDKIEFVFGIILKIITFVGILPLWLAVIFLIAGVLIAVWIIVDQKGQNRMGNVIKYEQTLEKLAGAQQEIEAIEHQREALNRWRDRLKTKETELETDRELLNGDIEQYEYFYNQLREMFKDAGAYPEMEKLVENGLRGQISVKELFAMELKPLIKSVGLTTYDQDQTVRKSLIKCVKGPYRTFVIDCFDILTGKGMPPVIVAYMLYYYLSTKQPD